jgi:hypothetical protein
VEDLVTQIEQVKKAGHKKESYLNDTNNEFLIKARRILNQIVDLMRRHIEEKIIPGLKELERSKKWEAIKEEISGRDITSYLSLYREAKDRLSWAIILEEVVERYMLILNTKQSIDQITDKESATKLLTNFEEAQRLYSDVTRLNVDMTADQHRLLAERIKESETEQLEGNIQSIDKPIAQQDYIKLHSNDVFELKNAIISASSAKEDKDKILPYLEKTKKRLDYITEPQSLTSKLNNIIKELETDRGDYENGENSKVAQLAKFIEDNAAYMTLETLKLANMQLNKYEGKPLTLETVIYALELALRMDEKVSKEALNEAIVMARQYQSEFPHYTVQNLLKEAEKRLEKIQYSENDNTLRDLRYDYISNMETELHLSYTPITSVSPSDESKHSNVTSHLLIERLRKVISKMSKVATSNDIYTQDMTRLVITRHNPIGQNVVRVLFDIISDDTKKSFFSGPKSSWDVIYNVKDSKIHEYLVLFEQNELIKPLIFEKKHTNLSLLFIHFLLSHSLLTHLFVVLIESPDYESTSLIKDLRYRDELFDTLHQLDKFYFEFNISSRADVLIASPISRLKGVIRAIVQYFVSNQVKTKMNLKLAGDESFMELVESNYTLGPLIREKLVNALLTMLNHKFKPGIFVKYHVWQLIQEVALLRKQTAVDLGGIDLPHVVEKINTYYNKIKTDNMNDAKFVAFVCLSLNQKSLAHYLESIYRDREIVQKYYEVNSGAFMLDDAMKKKTLKFLTMLSDLSFKLYWNEDEREKKRSEVRQALLASS